MFKRKISLLVLLALLAFIGTGQFGTSGCGCPLIPMLVYEYKVPYLTFNNPEPDRIALFCYTEIEYYDSQDNLLEDYTQRRDLVKIIIGDTGFGEQATILPPHGISNEFRSDAIRLNIPTNAVKAKVKFHVGAHYLLNDYNPPDYVDNDDGIEAFARNFFLGINQLTGWEKEEEDLEGVHQAVAEIMSDGTLHGKFIGGHEHDIDQGRVTFVAWVALQ